MILNKEEMGNIIMEIFDRVRAEQKDTDTVEEVKVHLGKIEVLLELMKKIDTYL